MFEARFEYVPGNTQRVTLVNTVTGEEITKTMTTDRAMHAKALADLFNSLV